MGFKASAQDTTDMEVVASCDGTNTLFKTNYVDAARDYTEYYSDARYKRLIREGYLERSSFYPDGNANQRDLLIMAVQRGDTNVLAKLLVAAPAMVKESDILIWASYRGDTNILAMLAPGAADVNRKHTNLGITPLHVARNAVTAEFLVLFGADIEAREDFRQTPLMYAAKNGNMGVAKYLLAKGASLEAKDWNGSTPLYIAVECQQTNFANFLLSKGAVPLKSGSVELRPEIYGEMQDPPLDLLFPKNDLTGPSPK
jgi:ankyrin repeat protein